MLNDDVFAVSGNFIIGFCDDPAIIPRPDDVEEEMMVLYTEEETKTFKNLSNL